jgi:hypothetical protein
VQRIASTDEPKPSLTSSTDPITAGDVNEAFSVVNAEPDLPQSGWYHWFRSSFTPAAVDRTDKLSDNQFTHVQK